MQSAHKVTQLKTKLRDPDVVLLAELGQTLWECSEYNPVMAETAVGPWYVLSPFEMWTCFEWDSLVGGLTGSLQLLLLMLATTSHPFLLQCCLNLSPPEPGRDAWACFSFVFHTVTLPRDNPMSDVYGANLYNNYLKSARHNQAQAGLKRSPEAGSPQAEVSLELRNDCNSSVESCESILVCTGVYRHNGDVPKKTEAQSEETVFHGHRDFCFDPSLLQASYIVQDVDDAVQLAFKKENWS